MPSNSIMSDCGRNRFNEEEDFQVVLGKRNPGESSCQQNSRWLADWTRASSSAHGKSCNPLEDANNNTCTKDSGTSLFELKKSSVAERLMLGGNYENGKQLSSNMWGLGDDVWQEAEQKKIEQRDGSFQSSMVQMQRTENFYAKTIVPETLSVRRFPDLPLDFQKLVNSDDNLDSHWNQLPMLSINQKVDCILNPKPRSATATVFDEVSVPQHTPELNVASSNLMPFSHQEYELQSHEISAGIMDHCKPARGIIRLLEDPTCLSSDPAGQKLKFDDNSFSDCLIGKQDTFHYFANPNQEPLSRFGVEKFNISENNDKGQSVAGASQNQKSRTPPELHGRQPLEKSTDSSKEKSPFLFEMLTTPSNLQSSYAKDFFGSQKQFSPRTEKLHGDAEYVSKSSAGITSSSAPKDNGCPEEANEQLATLSIQGSPRHNEESRVRQVYQDTSSKTDLCIPGTENMDLDPLPCQPTRERNQAPNSATQSSPTRTDPSDRWLKRLRHDDADPRVSYPKSRKTGDHCPVGGASRMSDTDIADHVAEKSVHCWVGRWCKGGSPVPCGHLDQRVGAAAVKPDVVAGELGVGAHFPSIKAMAMMGRVMSKVRPLDRQRKGRCVMWKTEGA